MDANAWAAIAAAVVATIALYFAAVSARAAKRAAAHAEVVAKVEEDRREEERDRRHEELAPLPLGRVATKETRNGLYASLHVPRVYLVRIGLSTSANPASDDDYTWQKQRFLFDHEPNDICIYRKWPLPARQPRLATIKIKYWSPDVLYLVGDDDMPPEWDELASQVSVSSWWKCPTDPLDAYFVESNQLSGHGHWEMRSRILHPDEPTEGSVQD
ncbi:hypothetical protein [Nonomuraea dietziae]|uniref:Uncharacterized protein n=1 Tax=Nonomuraea dietziae TaxID=65515 RepID=A0A7W5VCV4_9ACTN|nr:hypothetical protein [Nonomuraea dietziae]MBB3733739.1 hypothetical protein [Nonomuraea dietziae]